MSKGSARRPRAVSYDQFAANWDAAFGTKSEPCQCQACGQPAGTNLGCNYCSMTRGEQLRQQSNENSITLSDLFIMLGMGPLPPTTTEQT